MKEHNLSEQELFIYNIGREWRGDILSLPFKVLDGFTDKDFNNVKKVWFDICTMMWHRIYFSLEHNAYIKESLTGFHIEKAKHEYEKRNQKVPTTGRQYGKPYTP